MANRLRRWTNNKWTMWKRLVLTAFVWKCLDDRNSVVFLTMYSAHLDIRVYSNFKFLIMTKITL